MGANSEGQEVALIFDVDDRVKTSEVAPTTADPRIQWRARFCRWGAEGTVAEARSGDDRTYLVKYDGGGSAWHAESELESAVGRPEDRAKPLRVGDLVVGFCGGAFGRDSYGEKTVEAVGADWVVVREDGGPSFFSGDPDSLRKYRRTRS